VNQAELHKMAEKRLKDAKALLDGGGWDFACYAAGYSVECGLKSSILARMIREREQRRLYGQQAQEPCLEMAA
jgi:HEPN domain-containing protein